MTAKPGATTDRVLAGRYRLGARRGAGLDIAIFEASDEQLGRPVAVRIVHPDICATPGFPERFRATMQQVASFIHPNIVSVLDWGPSDWNGQPVQFVVTENLTGGSLRDLLDRGRHLSPSQALVVGLDVCRALDTAHRHGLVHGDVRPANIVFGDDGHLRVVDLGLSQLAGETIWAEPSAVSIERARYASPERAKGLPPEPKSDVYALALLLIETVSGHVPFAGDSAVATLANRVGKLMPVSADLGPLAAVLERAGRPESDTRYTAAEFGRAMMVTAEKLPRPAPIPLVGGGLSGDSRSNSTGVSESAAALHVATVPDRIVATLAPPDLSTRVATPAATPVTTHLTTTSSDPTAVLPVAGGREADSDATRMMTVPVTPFTAAEIPAARLPATHFATTQMPATQVSAQRAGVPGSTVVIGTTVPPPPPADELPPLLRERRSRRKLLAVVAVILLAAGIGGAIARYINRDQSNLVPDLVGLDVGAALNEISEFGWDTVETIEASDAVAERAIIRTQPSAGIRLDRGDRFALVVSGGPAPRVLPDISGMTVQQAAATLGELGLLLQEGERSFDEIVPAGTILSWLVPGQPGLGAGGTALPGTAIVVNVSAGPEPRLVPPLTGLALAEAVARLQALGLTATPLPDEFSETAAAGTIARQNPPPGFSAARGSAVEIAVSKGRDLVTVPSLAASTVAQVTEALTAAGLVLGEVKGDPAGLAVLAEVNGATLSADVLLPRGTPVAVTFEVPAPPTTEAPPTTVAPTTTVAPPETTPPSTTPPSTTPPETTPPETTTG